MSKPSETIRIGNLDRVYQNSQKSFFNQPGVTDDVAKNLIITAELTLFGLLLLDHRNYTCEGLLDVARVNLKTAYEKTMRPEAAEELLGKFIEAAEEKIDRLMLHQVKKRPVNLDNALKNPVFTMHKKQANVADGFIHVATLMALREDGHKCGFLLRRGQLHLEKALHQVKVSKPNAAAMVDTFACDIAAQFKFTRNVIGK